MCIYTHMYIVCIYIYIHIHTERERERERETTKPYHDDDEYDLVFELESSRISEARLFVPGQNITPDLTKVKFHLRIPLKIHCKFPVKIHWASDNPLENAT